MTAVDLSLWFVSLLLCSSALDQGEPDKYHAVHKRFDVNNTLEKAEQDGETSKQQKEIITIPGFRWPNQLRSKRSTAATITTVCNIIEVMAVADYSVWNFFLSQAASNVINAEKSLNDHYKALFSEVDLMYKCLAPTRCVRVLLVNVLIQKTVAVSWSSYNVGGNVYGGPGLNKCGTFICSPADLVLCFTRENIMYGNTQTIGLAYIGNICLPNYFRSIVLEDFHDGISRVAAKLILVQLGILFDGSIGCNNADGFIGSELNTIPINTANMWMFSSCSKSGLDSTFSSLLNSCLLKGSVTELELAEMTAAQEPAGEIVDLNHQCKLAFGTSSQACLPPATATIPETVGICVQGVFCLVGGACTERVQVYNGSPCGCGKSCYKGTCIGQFNIPLEGDCRDDCNCMTVNGVCTTIPGGKKVCRCAATNTANGNGVCVQIQDCSTPPIVLNGMFTSIGTFDGVEAFSLACNVGYTADNTETCIHCTQIGGFTTSPAACIRDCGKVPGTTNGFLSLDLETTTLGAMATLSCCKGYMTSASVQITCEATGWSNPGETCTQRGCPAAGTWILDGDRRSCYLFGDTDLTYQDARDFCDNFDDASANIQSNLVQVDSRGELLYLKEYLLNVAAVPTFGYWNDLFQTTTNGNEVWRTTGDALLIEDWATGAPNDGGGGGNIQSCTAFIKANQYQQNDQSCKNSVRPLEKDFRLYHALCEIKLLS